jgi:hypothetical protein
MSQPREKLEPPALSPLGVQGVTGSLGYHTAPAERLRQHLLLSKLLMLNHVYICRETAADKRPQPDQQAQHRNTAA